MSPLNGDQGCAVTLVSRFAFSRCEQARVLLGAWHGALMDRVEAVHFTRWRSKPDFSRVLCFKISPLYRTCAPLNSRVLTWSDKTYSNVVLVCSCPGSIAVSPLTVRIIKAWRSSLSDLFFSLAMAFARMLHRLALSGWFNAQMAICRCIDDHDACIRSG